MIKHHDCKTPFKHPKGRGEIKQKKISTGTYEIENADPKITMQRVRVDQFTNNWILMCGGYIRTETQKSFLIEWLAEVKRGHVKAPFAILFN